jgi:hypothetical protein
MRYGVIALLLAVCLISIPRIEALGLLGPMSDWADQIFNMECIFRFSLLEIIPPLQSSEIQFRPEWWKLRQFRLHRAALPADHGFPTFKISRFGHLEPQAAACRNGATSARHKPD